MASLMRRLGSMRRGTNVQVRSPGGDSEHGDKGSKYFKCNVAMLDDSYKTFDVEVIAIVLYKFDCVLPWGSVCVCVCVCEQ